MLIITGMHRSGTSLAAQLTKALRPDAVSTGPELPADRWNPHGYHEPLDVVTANDRLLLGDRRYPRAHHTEPRSQRPLTERLGMRLRRVRFAVQPSLRALPRRAQRLQPEIEALADAYCDRIVKDPRFCMTLGVWRPLASIERVLFCFRHPRAVARSLQRRDRLPLALGHRLWARHIETFLRNAHALPCTLLDYDRLLDRQAQPAELERIAAFAGVDVHHLAGDRLTASIDTAGRHYGTETPVPARCRALYEQLRELHRLHARPWPLSAPGSTPDRDSAAGEAQ